MPASNTSSHVFVVLVIFVGCDASLKYKARGMGYQKTLKVGELHKEKESGKEIKGLKRIRAAALDGAIC